MTRKQSSISIHDIDYESQQIIEAAKGEMLIVLIAMLGGEVHIPVEVLDNFPVGRGIDLKAHRDVLTLELVESDNTKTKLPAYMRVRP